MKKSDKQFVSEIDKKLAEFDASHPKTPSQQAEIDKHARVYRLRDHPSFLLQEENDDLWD